MIKLPNDCSDLSVFPKNWDKAGASLNLDWRIQYYFRDPAFMDAVKKQVRQALHCKRHEQV